MKLFFAIITVFLLSATAFADEFTINPKQKNLSPGLQLEVNFKNSRQFPNKIYVHLNASRKAKVFESTCNMSGGRLNKASYQRVSCDLMASNPSGVAAEDIRVSILQENSPSFNKFSISHAEYNGEGLFLKSAPKIFFGEGVSFFEKNEVKNIPLKSKPLGSITKSPFAYLNYLNQSLENIIGLKHISKDEGEITILGYDFSIDEYFNISLSVRYGDKGSFSESLPGKISLFNEVNQRESGLATSKVILKRIKKLLGNY